MWKVRMEDNHYNKFEFYFTRLSVATEFISVMNDHVDVTCLKFRIEYEEEGEKNED